MNDPQEKNTQNPYHIYYDIIWIPMPVLNARV